MDELTRELERQAANGDLLAAKKLTHYYARSGNEKQATFWRRYVDLQEVTTRRQWLKARLSHFTTDYTGDPYFEEHPEEVIDEFAIRGRPFLRMIFEGVFPLYEAPIGEIEDIVREANCGMMVDGDGMMALIYPKGEGYGRIAQQFLSY